MKRTNKAIQYIDQKIEVQERRLAGLREQFDQYDSNHPIQQREIMRLITQAVNAIEKWKKLKEFFEGAK